MYKARITKWGLDKKTKEAEALALLRIKTQRDAVGKNSAFRVRGKPVTIDDVLRYFKRKGIIHPEVTPHSPKASTPPAIEYWTPLPSPRPGTSTIQVPEQEDVQSEADLLNFRGAETNVLSCPTTDSSPGIGDVHAYLNIDQTRQLLFSSSEIQSFEIAHSPLPPQSLLVPEKLFASIKAYYCGAFAEGLFKTNKDGDLIHVNGVATYNRLYDFYELCMTGVELMSSEFFVEGRRCLSKALALVSNILCNQDPRTLESILSLLIILRKEGHNRISTILRDLVGRMAIVLFDKEHSWRQIFSQIGTLDDSHFEPAIAEAWRCTCDILINTLGQFHRTTLECYAGFTNTVYGSNGATQLIYDLLIQGEQELGKFDERLLSIKFEYGEALYFQGRDFEARAMLEEVLTHYCLVGGEDGKVIMVLEMISFCEYHIGHNCEAESKIRQAIKMAEERYGKFNSILLSLKVCLEGWLRGWGREAEAVAMKAEIDEILGPDDIELEDVTF